MPTRGEVVLSLKRMSRVVAVDVDNDTLTVEAGCTLQDAQMAARHAGRFFPLSIASEGTATVGGNLSTNAGGVHVLRYGTMRDLTLGLEVVLPDGRIWNGLRGLRKDNSGYDLKQLFIGAEGTLGVITAAVLRMCSAPRYFATAWVSVPSPSAALRLLSRMKSVAGNRISGFELIGRNAINLVLRHVPGSREPLRGESPWQVLVELSDTTDSVIASVLESGLSSAVEAGEVLSAAIAHSERQASEFWALRENISEAQRIEGISIKHDVSLPLSCVADFLVLADGELARYFPGLHIVCFGHLGDGNLHYNLSMLPGSDNSAFVARTSEVNRIVHDLVSRFGGSIAAEHGIGQLKREEVARYKSPVEIELMRTIKSALDPLRLMNPGKVL